MKRRIEIRQWERQLDKPNLEGKPASPEHRAFRKIVEIDDADENAPVCCTCDAVPMRIPIGARAFLVERDLASGEEKIHLSVGVSTAGTPLALFFPGKTSNFCQRMSLEEALEILEGRKGDGWEEFSAGLEKEIREGVKTAGAAFSRALHESALKKLRKWKGPR